MGDVRPPLTRFRDLGEEGRRRIDAMQPLVDKVESLAADFVSDKAAVRA
jgi:hypothetical protein